MLLEGHSWRNIFLKVAARLAILTVVPLSVVVGADFELNGVVIRRYSGYIPLKLLDFASLVHMSQHNREKESNQTAKSRGCCHLVVLIIKLAFFNNALELRVEVCILVFTTCRDQVRVFRVSPKCRLRESKIMANSKVRICRITNFILGVFHTGSMCVKRVDAVIGDFADYAIITG